MNIYYHTLLLFTDYQHSSHSVQDHYNKEGLGSNRKTIFDLVWQKNTQNNKYQ